MGVASICYLFSIGISVLFVISINGETVLRKMRLSTRIKKQVSKNNRTIIVENLREIGKPEKSVYLFLLAPLFTAGLIFALPFIATFGEDFEFGVYVIVSMFTSLYLLGALLAFIHLFELITGKKKDFTLSDFVTDDEFNFLIGNSDKMTTLDSNVLKRTVLAPEELIPFFLNKRKINVFIDMQTNMNTVQKGKTQYLTKEQTQRNEQVLQEFKKTIKSLDVLLEDFEHATSEDYRPKTVEEKQDILETVGVNGRFDTVHRDIENTLMQMNQDVTFKKGRKVKDVPLPIQELNRVAQSDQVSTEIKTQANELLDRIKEKESEEKSAQEKEHMERDALAVIEASKQYFGIRDDR